MAQAEILERASRRTPLCIVKTNFEQALTWHMVCSSAYTAMGCKKSEGVNNKVHDE